MIDYHPPVDTGLELLYTDDVLLIASKPAGLLSVPGRGPDCRDCLISRVQQEYPEALIVHRLDMSTSGLMIMARNADIHRLLSRQFEQRLVDKSYLAVVTGKVDPVKGTIELPLICDWPNRPRQIVDHNLGKQALTKFQVLNYDVNTDTTRIELKPFTGRTHQLRVHMQAIGHPILGDDLYADESTLSRSDRLLLHATSLSFNHPETDEAMVFNQEAPF